MNDFYSIIFHKIDLEMAYYIGLNQHKFILQNIDEIKYGTGRLEISKRGPS